MCDQVESNFLGHFLPQYLYTGPDVTVYRFENFAEDISELLRKLDIQKEITKQNAVTHEHYSTYYTDVTKDIVAQIYKQDIELFGYAFETKI
jgi:hypothetical protein